MDPIDSFSSVDHDEFLAQCTLVLVSRDDDVVHASPPNHNRNRFIGYGRNGSSGEDEVVLRVRMCWDENGSVYIP